MDLARFELATSAYFEFAINLQRQRPTVELQALID